MSPEGCPAKKQCGLRHTWYVAAPLEVGPQPQIGEYRKTNPRPFPPGERELHSSDPPSAATLDSYRPNSHPPAPPRSVHDPHDGPDPRFGALVRALSDGRQELCSKAAAQILSIDKAVYHKAGVRNWSEFLGLAQHEELVDLGRGEVPGREWVKLSAKGLAQVPGRAVLPSSSSISKQRSPSMAADRARVDRQSSQGSRADVEDQLDLTFDDLIGELGLPPPTEEQAAANAASAAQKASLLNGPTPSSDFNGYSSSPTKMASVAAPASSTTLGGLGSDELADLRRQVVRLSQSVETLQEDLEYERKKRGRAEARAEEAEERATVLEQRWKAARAAV